MGSFGRFVSRLADRAGRLDPSVPRPYDDRDRREQLRRCELLATELGDLHAHHGHPAGGYRALADGARRLLEDGFARDDLEALARRLPPAAGWMNPKAIDSGLPVEPWHREAAALRGTLSAAVLELRAAARYGDAP